MNNEEFELLLQKKHLWDAAQKKICWMPRRDLNLQLRIRMRNVPILNRFLQMMMSFEGKDNTNPDEVKRQWSHMELLLYQGMK